MKKIIILIFFVGSCLVLRADDFSLTFEFSQGIFKSNNNIFDRIYGHTYPTFVGMGFIANKYNVKLTAGIGFFKKKGESIILPENSGISPDELEFKNISFPINLIYTYKMGKLKPFLIGGFSINRVSEKWASVPIYHSYVEIGYAIGGGADFYSKNNWSLSGGITYSSINLDKTQKYLDHLSLSGYNFFIQISYKLF